MITKIIGKKFKGQSFEQPLAKLNLVIGANGSGKSARTDALINTRYNVARSQNQAFYNAFGGPSNQMSIGFSTESLSFEKIFLRSRKGTVSQKYVVSDSHGQAQQDFEHYMSRTPAIFDLRGFMDLSDQKKIDMIFSLFPPAGDPVKLAAQIEEKTLLLNSRRAALTEIEGVINRLTSSRTAIQLPSGNLASVKAEIAAIEEQLKTARADLAAAEKERIEAEAKVKAEAEAKAKTEEEKRQAKPAVEINEDIKPAYVDPLELQRKQAEASLMAKNQRMGIGVCSSVTAESSIKRILDTLTGAQCDECAAVLVARNELKKHQQQNNMRF